MDEVGVGPVDLLMVKFPGNQFKGEIGPALRDLVTGGLIRILDLTFVYKDAAGVAGSVELAGLSADLGPAFVDINGETPGGLLEPEDVDEVAAGLEPNSSVAVLVVENLWAIPFVTAMNNAGAEMIDQARIPANVVASALAQ